MAPTVVCERWSHSAPLRNASINHPLHALHHSHLGASEEAALRRRAVEVEPVTDDPLYLRGGVSETPQLRLGRALGLQPQAICQHEPITHKQMVFVFQLTSAAA